MMGIAALQRRCERLFKKADELQDYINDHEDITNFMNHEFVRKRRQMFSLYSEASTISICLTAFQNSCYEPLGPLV